MTEKISTRIARRIVLAAQGFGERRPTAPVGRSHLKRYLGRNGLLQMDSVNILVRAHYMPMFSRYGAYPLDLIDKAAKGKRRTMFEYWAHEASLLPVETWPLMRFRMQRAARGERIYKGVATFGVERAAHIEALYREIERNGPMAASDFESEKGPGGWWGWNETKIGLEWLFWAGRITTAHRRASFERVYDLPERVLPPEIVNAPEVSAADATRELLRISAKAMGVSTATHLRDYFRLAPDDVKRGVPELVEAGELIPVKVECWSQPAYLYRDARQPRRIDARALLSPFDPLVWERDRAEGLFGFFYRIEIYVPAHKRVHGYYVLPFLLGDGIAARVDLKGDRQAGILRVLAAHREPGAAPHVAEALAEELRLMAGWLGLAKIEVSDSGDLAKQLKGAVG
ncbi:MAG: winged helix-turn-helix domain-containing protein [Rhizobiaceae bacterium]